MNLETVRSFLMWCFIINYGLLLFWSALFIFFHDGFNNLLQILLRRKIEHMDSIQILAMTLFKLGVILFNLVPWIALTISK